MKVQRKEALFWSESLNEVMRGFSVNPSLEVVFGDLFTALERIDKILSDFRKETAEKSNEEVLDVEGITKEHLEVLKIAMEETIKEIREWELPLRTSSTADEAKNYLKNIETYIKMMP